MDNKQKTNTNSKAEYPINGEIMSYLRQKNLRDLWILLILMVFLILNGGVLFTESKLQNQMDIVNEQARGVQLEDEYISYLSNGSYVNKTQILNSLDNLKGLHYVRIRFDQNAFYLLYNNASMNQIQEDMDQLKTHYSNIQIVSVDEDKSSSQVGILVTL